MRVVASVNPTRWEAHNTMKNTIVVILILVGAAIASERTQYIYKLSRLSATEVGISCTNGGDPTGNKIGDTLIISCGKGGR